MVKILNLLVGVRNQRTPCVPQAVLLLTLGSKNLYQVN